MNDTTIESKRTGKLTKNNEGSESTRSTFVNTYPDIPPTTAAKNPRAEPPSNEYVLNFAFFSFLAFMTVQAFFAVAAKSQSMLADSLAMSVDAFTYLFNLAAERLKHRSPQHYQYLSVEEAKRKKKMIRLYLELIPPMISVCALLVVSTQALLDAVTTIISPPEMAGDAGVVEPDINVMLIFSSFNLGLDLLNVTCFSKVQNFSMTGDLTVKGDDDYESRQSLCGLDEKEIALTKDEDIESESPRSNNVRSPSKVREFPPSIVFDNSNDSSFESNGSGGINYDEDTESGGLLGIVMPNYGSQRSDLEWGDEFSHGVVHDGLTSEAVAVTRVETGDSVGSGAASASSNSHQSRRNKAHDIGIGRKELSGIAEGDENSSDDKDGSCEMYDGDASNDGNDSETSGRGFNLNMCSAYTVSFRYFALWSRCKSFINSLPYYCIRIACNGRHDAKYCSLSRCRNFFYISYRPCFG